MLDISSFVTRSEQGIHFSQLQASQFAKGVAGDFNPIHDVGAKRFCVPGDLLFAALLNHYGVYQHLQIDLMTLVNADLLVALPNELSAENDIHDNNDRLLMSLNVSGESTDEPSFVSTLVEQYVQFSGRTFPEILVELMREHNVMINPARPLVIYKDMSITLNSLQADNLSLLLDKATMDVDGRKAKACLQFIIKNGNDTVGHGEKNMLLSGLREFDQNAMDDIVNQYTDWKTSYQATPPKAQ